MDPIATSEPSGSGDHEVAQLPWISDHSWLHTGQGVGEVLRDKKEQSSVLHSPVSKCGPCKDPFPLLFLNRALKK